MLGRVSVEKNLVIDELYLFRSCLYALQGLQRAKQKKIELQKLEAAVNYAPFYKPHCTDVVQMAIGGKGCVFGAYVVFVIICFINTVFFLLKNTFLNVKSSVFCVNYT